MSDNGSQQPHPAYCEEFNEEAQTSLPETKQSANISAKRSKPDLPSTKPVRDEFSDSGYCSHLNSSLGSKVEVDHSNALNYALVKHDGREPANETTRSESHGAKKETGKRAEPKSRRDVSARRRDCLCEKCVAAHRYPALTDLHLPSQNIFGQPRPKTPAPPSPQSKRVSTPDAMPLREHFRPRAATSSRARPMSFHAGATPDPTFIAAQPMYVIERQPTRQAMYPFLPPSYPPPQSSYFQPVPPQPPPQEVFAPMPLPYEMQPQARPRPRQRASEHGRPRPQSLFYVSPPPLEHAGPIYKTVEPAIMPLEQKLSSRDRRTSIRESHSSPNEDYRKMPPPPPPPPRIDTRSRQEQRPNIRHAATTSAPYHDLRQRENDYEKAGAQVSGRDWRRPSVDHEVRPRRPSLARPSKTSDEKVVSFDDIERGVSHLDIEPSNTKSRRRSSVYGYESLEEKEGSVEAYQQSKGTLRPSFTPSREDVMRLVRKKTNTDSDAGSRVSAHSKGSRGSKEESDVKARKVVDRWPSNDVNARSENDRFALKFNPEGINVKMQGGIEGRAINFRKSKDGDGDMELSIGSRVGIESSRGRTVGSRPSIREKSHKRYSYMEGQGTAKELDNMRVEAATRPTSIARVNSKEEEGPRIIGERIITTMRSRRSSRYGYDGRERMI